MSASRIPFVLHQIGPSEHVPAHLEAFRQSWSHWNPDLEVILWTDASLRAFIAEHAQPFLPIFDGFPRGVCRADLGRYLLLQHFGGIYADLDCQCLQPLKPLLENRELVLASEPEEHERSDTALRLGLHRIVCPSFLASVPLHPLWSEVLAAIHSLDVATVQTNDAILVSTGPGLLTRLVNASTPYATQLVPEAWLYPFSKADCWQGRIFDPVFWSARCRDAFVAHHWDGSWFRRAGGMHAGVPSRAPVHLHEPLPSLKQPLPAMAAAIAANLEDSSLPLVSCLMVTRGRLRQAQLAISSFLQQTYPSRELVMLDDSPDGRLAEWINRLDNPLIRVYRMPDQGLPLGALRNLSLDLAQGDYVCQWDDDDLQDPVRLEVQLRTMHATSSLASVLARWMIWWPASQRLALSCYRDWEGSLLCHRSLMPQYPASLRRGEDTVLLDELKRKARLARIDMPRLYLYVVHGSNTFDASHFEEHWTHATARWQGGELGRLLPELSRRLPLVDYQTCV